MALINTGPDYTRTGDNFLTRWGNKASFIPLIGGPIAGFLGVAGAVVESVGWVFRGKFLSAATALAAGTVSAGLNSASSIFTPLEGVRWFVNAGSGLTTGASLGTHGRAATEAVIGSIAGVFGQKPTILRSYQAGIGSIGGGAAPAGPGYYATMHGGTNPQAKWDNYRNGAGADHLAQLEASRAGGPNFRGA